MTHQGEHQQRRGELAENDFDVANRGDVSSSSIVPERFSSAYRRIVIIGIRKKPMTLAFESSGRITHSFTSIGWARPIIWDSIPRMTKNASRAVEEESENHGEDRHQQIGDRRSEVALQLSYGK